MKKMLFALVVIFSLRALYATGYAAPRFDKMAFASKLPPGWSVVEIRKDTYPYGFLENTETLGLCISLGGQQQVLDKRTPVKESLVVWLMPVSYPAERVPDPGTPHRPARLIGKNERYAAFALPWTETPSWRTWEKDLQLILALAPSPPPELASVALAAAVQPKRSDAVIEKVRSITADMLGLTADKLGDDTRLGSLPRRPDDLDIVELVLSLEDAFTIEIPDADLERAAGGRTGGLASLSRDLTVSKLAALVQKQLDRKAKVKNRGSRK